MKHIHFHEKYPITVVEVNKSETSYASVNDIAEYFRKQIAANDKVAYIGTFDHYAHTAHIGC